MFLFIAIIFRNVLGIFVYFSFPTSEFPSTRTHRLRHGEMLLRRKPFCGFLLRVTDSKKHSKGHSQKHCSKGKDPTKLSLCSPWEWGSLGMCHNQCSVRIGFDSEKKHWLLSHNLCSFSDPKVQRGHWWERTPQSKAKVVERFRGSNAFRHRY